MEARTRNSRMWTGAATALARLPETRELWYVFATRQQSHADE